MEGQLWLGGLLGGGVRRRRRGLWGWGRQTVQGKDLGRNLGLATKASLSRNPKHLSPPWQADLISSFACVLEVQRGAETVSEAGRPWAWPWSPAAWPSGPCLGTEAEGEAPGSFGSGLWAWWELGDRLCPPGSGCLP